MKRLGLRRPGSSMRAYWDRKAAENPWYFIDSRVDYSDPDQDRFWSGAEEDLDRMLGRLEVRIEDGDDVVEIGCGIGRLTRPIAERCSSVRALDVSGRMLDLARRHNPHLDNVEWVQGDGTSLEPLRSDSADAICSYIVFHHVPGEAIVLGYVREMGRVLRSGGWAAFQVSNDFGHHDRRASMGSRILNPLRTRIRGVPRGQFHPAWRGTAVDLERLEDAAGQAGMRVERIEGRGSVECLVLLRRN